MAKLPVVTARQALQALRRAGFVVHHQTGAHVHLRHPGQPRLRIVVPNHPGDLAPKTLRSILTQANLTVDEFLLLL
jgi:predicted RNA binding protein YcfA (HicA-like mRNA interferase family)